MADPPAPSTSPLYIHPRREPFEHGLIPLPKLTSIDPQTLAQIRDTLVSRSDPVTRRVDPDSLSEALQKTKTEPQQEEDRISSIPDEILISLISLLPTTQSVRTSTLSKRWLNLWKSVPHLSLIFRSLKFSNLNFPKNTTISANNMMDSQAIESILSNCPFLEEFRLIGLNSVRTLTIRCNKIKNLEILGCCNLRRLNLFAPELVSFKYNGPDVEYVFGDVPHLVELTFVDSYCLTVVRRAFAQFGPILEQLVKLNLIMDFPWIAGCPLVDELNGIKELRLDITVWDSRKTFYLFFHLLEALPFVNVVSLRLFWPENHEVSELGVVGFNDYEDYLNDLRVFEMDGFISAGLEVEIIECLVDWAELLEKVVIRVARRASVESDEDLMDACEREDAMNNAREYISPILPEATRFVLL